LVFLYWTRNTLIAAAKPTQNPPTAA